MSPLATSEISNGLDPHENNEEEEEVFRALEDTLSRSSDASSHSTCCPNESPRLESPPPGPSQAPFYSAVHAFSDGSPTKFKVGLPVETKRPNNKRKSDDERIANRNASRARLLNLNPTAPPPFDENESFGKTIGLLLRNASKEQRIYARKLMYEVMTEAELGNLSRESYFVAHPKFNGARKDDNVQDRYS